MRGRKGSEGEVRGQERKERRERGDERETWRNQNILFCVSKYYFTLTLQAY